MSGKSPNEERSVGSMKSGYLADDSRLAAPRGALFLVTRDGVNFSKNDLTKPKKASKGAQSKEMYRGIVSKAWPERPA
jgi:hypothetical protein